MNGRLLRAILVGLVLATVAGWAQLLGGGVPWALLAGVAAAVLMAGGAWLAIRRAGDLQAWLRDRFWAAEAGNFHAFGGVTLQVEDDGRQVWLGGTGLLRVLGRKEPDDVLAARMPGQWRTDDKGRLLLRVDAVVNYLGHMPERNDPRVQKLRRYLERDVLHPAAERRRRAR